MNRGRQRSAKHRAEGQRQSIDLGIALAVYGKDADGKLVELQPAAGQEPCWYGFSLKETWPTEQ